MVFLFVRGRGFEPPRPCGHIHLKDACLPVPTPAQNYFIFELYLIKYLFQTK